jgi:hypothetical protein
MGFDVYGNREDSYFRNNVWYWKPMWNYVAEVCNLSDEAHEAGLVNDGYAISKTQANKISETLFGELKANRTQTYDLKHKKYLKELPLKTCKFCNGTGTRDYKGEDINCNVCNTESTRKEGIPIGKEKNWETNYSFDVGNVREFAEFCKESDGFEIC